MGIAGAGLPQEAVQKVVGGLGDGEQGDPKCLPSVAFDRLDGIIEESAIEGDVCASMNEQIPEVLFPKSKEQDRCDKEEDGDRTTGKVRLPALPSEVCGLLLIAQSFFCVEINQPVVRESVSNHIRQRKDKGRIEVDDAKIPIEISTQHPKDLTPHDRQRITPRQPKMKCKPKHRRTDPKKEKDRYEGAIDALTCKAKRELLQREQPRDKIAL